MPPCYLTEVPQQFPSAWLSEVKLWKTVCLTISWTSSTSPAACEAIVHNVREEKHPGKPQMWLWYTVRAQREQKNSLPRAQIPFPHNLGLLAGGPAAFDQTSSGPSVSPVYIPSCKLSTNSFSRCAALLWIPCDDGTQPQARLFVYVFHSCSRCWKWLKASVLRDCSQLSYVGSFHQWHRSLLFQIATVSTAGEDAADAKGKDVKLFNDDG